MHVISDNAEAPKVAAELAARWKVQHIGRYVLNGTRPPRHGLL